MPGAQATYSSWSGIWFGDDSNWEGVDTDNPVNGGVWTSTTIVTSAIFFSPTYLGVQVKVGTLDSGRYFSTYKRFQ